MEAFMCLMNSADDASATLDAVLLFAFGSAAPLRLWKFKSAILPNTLCFVALEDAKRYLVHNTNLCSPSIALITETNELQLIHCSSAKEKARARDRKRAGHEALGEELMDQR